VSELEAVAAEDTGIRADLRLLAMNVRQKKFDARWPRSPRSRRSSPTRPLPHDLRGSVLLAKQDAAGARKSFERALAIDPPTSGGRESSRDWTSRRRSRTTR
jgi:predicted negative regulator of RcsB-dependent stress response